MTFRDWGKTVVVKSRRWCRCLNKVMQGLDPRKPYCMDRLSTKTSCLSLVYVTMSMTMLLSCQNHALLEPGWFFGSAASAQLDLRRRPEWVSGVHFPPRVSRTWLVRKLLAAIVDYNNVGRPHVLWYLRYEGVYRMIINLI